MNTDDKRQPYDDSLGGGKDDLDLNRGEVPTQ